MASQERTKKTLKLISEPQKDFYKLHFLHFYCLLVNLSHVILDFLSSTSHVLSFNFFFLSIHLLQIAASCILCCTMVIIKLSFFLWMMLKFEILSINPLHSFILEFMFAIELFQVIKR